MKRLLLLFCFITLSSQAQILDIPDANFKAKLLQASPSENIASDIDGNFVSIDTNGDNEIQLNEALVIYGLNINNTDAVNFIGIEAFTNLTQFFCSDNNSLIAIDLSQNVNISNLGIGTNNSLVSLDISQNEAILELSIAFNQSFSNINLTGCTNLEYLFLDGNQLTSLDLSTNTNLINVFCMGNQLTSLITPNSDNLTQLVCDNNPLLTELDLSQNTGLSLISAASCGLEVVLLKNGFISEWVVLGDNPNLSYVCIDEEEEDSVLVPLSTLMNSYCSFEPGGDYNTITGIIQFDADNDGCDMADISIQHINLEVDNGTDIEYIISNSVGIYNYYNGIGDFIITPIIENPSWFTFQPTSVNVIFDNIEDNIVTEDFCLVAVGIHNDLEITINAIESARPGFDATYQISYKNIGNQIVSGDITFEYDDSVLDFISSSESVASQSTGNLTWNYVDLFPFESRSILVTLNVNSPMENPAVNIGDILDFSATITPVIDDETPNDNTFTYQEIVVGSFDPNDITCLEGDIVAPEMIGEYLHYNVRFENTGTGAATFVVVANDIDVTKYDLNSFQIIHSSHEMMTRMTDNKVEFIFDDINLEPEGMGNVVFKIKTRSNLNIGDSVAQQANIYFDFNFPIETNVATTTFQEPLSVNEFTQDNAVNVYPNPTSGQVFIDANYPIQSLELYDIQGRKVQVFTISEEQAIDLTITSKGVYFLRIQTDKGTEIEKLIKN